MYRAIKALNCFLFFPALSNYYPVIIIPMSTQPSIYTRSLENFLDAFLFHILLNMSGEFPMFQLLFPRNMSQKIRIRSISFLFCFLQTPSLLTYFVHVILSSRFKNHISLALSLKSFVNNKYPNGRLILQFQRIFFSNEILASLNNF